MSKRVDKPIVTKLSQTVKKVSLLMTENDKKF